MHTTDHFNRAKSFGAACGEKGERSGVVRQVQSRCRELPR